MTCATTAYPGVTPYGGRILSLGASSRAVSKTIAVGLGSVAVTGAIIASVTVAAAWLVGAALSAHPHNHAEDLIGPDTIALTAANRRLAGRVDITGAIQIAAAQVDPRDASFDAKWARATDLLPASSAAASHMRKYVLAAIDGTASRQDRARRDNARTDGLKQVAELTPATAPAFTLPAIVPLPRQRAAQRAHSAPLPRPRPPSSPPVLAKEETVASPAARAKPQAPKPQVAAVAPPQRLSMATPEPIFRKRAMLPPADTHELSLPGSHSHTAIYDIEAHTVYLPDGERLEAHSGLGNGFDNPRYVDVRMHGPTPPNLYDLTLREQIFHGVRAIRLNPVDEDKMHGRAGMLAHSYMLGPSGASFGCVSFKDYPAFLHAYLNGEVDRLRVVAHLDSAPTPVARAGSRDDMYAFNNR